MQSKLPGEAWQSIIFVPLSHSPYSDSGFAVLLLFIVSLKDSSKMNLIHRWPDNNDKGNSLFFSFERWPVSCSRDELVDSKFENLPEILIVLGLLVSSCHFCASIIMNDRIVCSCSVVLTWDKNPLCRSAQWLMADSSVKKPQTYQ